MKILYIFSELISAIFQVLKMEAFVLIQLAKKGGRHFCKIEDKGRCNSLNYIVMTLVGRSLQELRKECPDGRLSMGTAISVGIQCLEALEDLHGEYFYNDFYTNWVAACKDQGFSYMNRVIPHID